MAQKIYVGDTGTVITLDCGQDISSATVRTIEVRKPDGTTASWTAAASGTDSITYTTQAGTLDQHGEWVLQAKVTLPTGVWLGASVAVTVYRAFE
jgi:hypothetical protein